MSQHREDRDDLSLRQFILIIGGADPREVQRGRSYRREVVLAVLIGLVMCGMIFWAAAAF